MEDRFGYGAIVGAMRPEEREEMLGLLLEARRGGDAASLPRAQMGSGTYRTSWRGLWRQPYPFHPEISMS